jgi:glycosyltransferase involved in cell wall biosynthesis
MKERFDIVMCYQTSPVLMANAARAVSKKQNIPFLLYCLDLWPECLKAWNVGEKTLLYKLIHSYSKKMYNSPEILAVSSKPFMDYHEQVNGVSRDIMLHLPQHSEDMKLMPKVRSSVEEPVVFAFGGNVGSVQNIECIIRATAKITAKESFLVEIYGDGSNLQNCKNLAKELGVENKVRFHGWVEKEILWKEYEKADAFLLTLKPEGFIGQTVPAKLQEYMSGNRPVFASIDYASEIIEEAGCGVCVPSDDSDALAEQMNIFIKNHGAMPGAAECGRKYFEAHYTKDCFMDTLEKVFMKLFKKRNSSK